MTAVVLTNGLILLLVVTALAGPSVLRQAAPALARTPRLTAAGFTLGALLWITTLLAVGLVVAWYSSGPAWLPGIAAKVCSRCLAAAQPFADSGMSVGIPAVIPLSLPLIGIILVIAGLTRTWWRSWRSARATAHSLAPGSERVTLF